MSTITREFTKEQLIAKAREQIAFCRNTKITGEGRAHVNQCSELFEIALASLEAEAVAYSDPQAFDNFKSMGGKNAACTKEWMWRDSGDGLIPVFTAPPAPVSVPDALADDIDSDDHPLLWSYNNGWNACRAAMLQSFGNSEQLNSPVVTDGWVACSERMPDVGDVVLTAKDGFVNVGEMERSGANYRYFTSIASGRELPATHWQPLPAAPQQEVKP